MTQFLLSLLTLAALSAASDPIELSVGETVAIDGMNLTLTFTAVPRDSRCPRDVNCIVAGEATVVLEATHNGHKTELTFKVPPGNQAEQTLDNISIKIIQLEPETDSTKKINPTDYTATITITQNGDRSNLSI